ncbi:MAG: fibronectin type III domain-containing protein [Verrucomicrobiota bacterium]|nr:fibronectin type III domain-containing protein [Verrucomicrobiota bacterium]
MNLFEKAFCLAALAGAIALPGCSTMPPANATAFATPTDLTAKLVDPLDIRLRWKDNATAEAGYFVEYSPDANNEFVTITALPPNSTTYLHPRLLPRTRFVFRVRAYFGPASATATVTTGREGPPEPPTAAEAADTNSPDAGIKKSIRSIATIAEAAPTDFRAMLIPPAGVKLDWVDHASDADGYLLEIKPQWSRHFKVSAFLPPHSTSLTSFNFPFNTRFTFRVRPFFYGQPSNLAEQTTGEDPTLGPGVWLPSGQSPQPPAHP